MSATASPQVTPDSPPPASTSDGRDVTRPVPFLRAARAVFDLSLEMVCRRSPMVALRRPGALAPAVRISSACRRGGGLRPVRPDDAFAHVRNAPPYRALYATA